MNTTTPPPAPLPPYAARSTIGARSVELEGLYLEVARSGRAERPRDRFATFALAFMAAHPGRTLDSVSPFELAQWWVSL